MSDFVTDCIEITTEFDVDEVVEQTESLGNLSKEILISDKKLAKICKTNLTLHPSESSGRFLAKGDACCHLLSDVEKRIPSLGDVISMEEGSLGARSIKGARTLVNLGISRDLPPPITETYKPQP
ncbi:Uncharacterized protein Fot_07856 [Forsythia ovata]|uniref:Uncharacterized protein n=1 Tax=Forsythia ovata TaxID=205694 RepID=A0ABD1WXF3_9LAMI